MDSLRDRRCSSLQALRIWSTAPQIARALSSPGTGDSAPVVLQLLGWNHKAAISQLPDKAFQHELSHFAVKSSLSEVKIRFSQYSTGRIRCAVVVSPANRFRALFMILNNP